MPPRKDLTLFEKIQIIELVSNGKSVKECMNVFEVGKTQIYCALKRKEELIREFESGKSDYKKLHRGPKDENLSVDERTWEWFNSCLERNIPPTGPMLQAKAKEIALEVGLMDFKASNGWLDCFKRRHGINWKALTDQRGNTERKCAIMNQFLNPHTVFGEAINISPVHETTSQDTYQEENLRFGVQTPNERREGKRGDSKRMNQVTNDVHLLIGEKTFEWYCDCLARRISMTKSMLQTRANEIALGLGEKDFNASWEWCEGFKQSYNISFTTPTSSETDVLCNVPTKIQMPGSLLKENCTPCLANSEITVTEEKKVKEERSLHNDDAAGIDLASIKSETSEGRGEGGGEEELFDLKVEIDLPETHTRANLVKSLEDGVFALKDIQSLIEENGLMDLKNEIVKFRRLYEKAVAERSRQASGLSAN